MPLKKAKIIVPPQEKKRRQIVLALALLGTVLSLGLTIKWMIDLNNPYVKKALITMRKVADSQAELAASHADVRAQVTTWDGKRRASFALPISAVLGVVGGVLAYRGRALHAGGVLLFGGLLPLLFTLAALLATTPLLAAGGL